MKYTTVTYAGPSEEEIDRRIIEALKTEGFRLWSSAVDMDGRRILCFKDKKDQEEVMSKKEQRHLSLYQIEGAHRMIIRAYSIPEAIERWKTSRHLNQHAEPGTIRNLGTEYEAVDVFE